MQDAYGYTLEYPIERWRREVREIQQLVIAGAISGLRIELNELLNRHHLEMRHQH